LRDKFQIIAFTASERVYADTVLDFIDPDNSIFDLRLYREHCIATEYGHVKDLRIIANRDLKDIALIDNSCLSFALNIDNGIPILPFFDNKEDEELRHLTYYLTTIYHQNVEDIRIHNRNAFQLLSLKDA
jgi:CTD small phosphatase-like protein 2